MPKGQPHAPEPIIAKLREAEVEIAASGSAAAACKAVAVAGQTSYRWREEYGGLRLDQAKRLEPLAGEDARPERLLADAEPDEATLKEAASGRY